MANKLAQLKEPANPVMLATLNALSERLVCLRRTVRSIFRGFINLSRQRSSLNCRPRCWRLETSERSTFVMHRSTCKYLITSMPMILAEIHIVRNAWIEFCLIISFARDCTRLPKNSAHRAIYVSLFYAPRGLVQTIGTLS